MIRTVLLLALPLLLLFGCNGGGTSEASPQDELETTVLAKHDSAMARMEEIYKLRRSLRTLRDTLDAQHADTATLQALQQQIDDLNGADEAMMDWMHHYQAPDSLEPRQAMIYLQQELQKIERVQVIMDSTITAARQTSKGYEQPK